MQERTNGRCFTAVGIQVRPHVRMCVPFQQLACIHPLCWATAEKEERIGFIQQAERERERESQAAVFISVGRWAFMVQFLHQKRGNNFLVSSLLLKRQKLVFFFFACFVLSSADQCFFCISIQEYVSWIDKWGLLRSCIYQQEIVFFLPFN